MKYSEETYIDLIKGSWFGMPTSLYYMAKGMIDELGKEKGIELFIKQVNQMGQGWGNSIRSRFTSNGKEPNVANALNDINETKAIKKLFGANTGKLVVSSTKSMTGHLLGAAGGIEAIATMLAIENSVIPPTINLTNPDPECDLNYSPLKATNKEIRYAISNTFGFGGHNASLLFKKFVN